MKSLYSELTAAYFEPLLGVKFTKKYFYSKQVLIVCSEEWGWRSSQLGPQLCSYDFYRRACLPGEAGQW
jgi:hypothetical protein